MKINYTKKELALIFLDGFLNLDYKHKRAIINLYDDVSEIFTYPDEAIWYLSENVSKSASNTFNLALNSDYLNELLIKYDERGVIVVTEESENYPNRLIPLEFRPICLYAKGNVNLLNANKTFAIVGSRKTQVDVMRLTESFASDFVNNNVVIVTGVASGGDKSAIKGAIQSGKLILVTASGFDYVKSETNRDLIEKTMQNGLVISEYAPEIPPKNYYYPIRNRIIAGLGDGTLIVSGNLTSGTRHTADYSLDYGKEVFCFPYGIGDKTGELCNNLIKDGARLVTSINDVFEVMGYELVENKALNLTDVEREVYTLIGDGVNSPDLIAIKTGKKIFELIPLLSSLELKGVAVKNNRNEYTVLK
ncbi:MAG: DNA-protecting protein DprA [Clostridia bacterium]|nr:DNA-protecting protein DprA [Clostridia bacterium]